MDVFGLHWATFWRIWCTFSDVLIPVGVVNVYLKLFGVIYARYDGKPQRHAYRDTHTHTQRHTHAHTQTHTHTHRQTYTHTHTHTHTLFSPRRLPRGTPPPAPRRAGRVMRGGLSSSCLCTSRKINSTTQAFQRHVKETACGTGARQQGGAATRQRRGGRGAGRETRKAPAGGGTSSHTHTHTLFCCVVVSASPTNLLLQFSINRRHV